MAKSACESRLSLQVRAWFSWHLGWRCGSHGFLLRGPTFCALLGRGGVTLLPQHRLTRLVLGGALLDQRDKLGKPGQFVHFGRQLVLEVPRLAAQFTPANAAERALVARLACAEEGGAPLVLVLGGLFSAKKPTGATPHVPGGVNAALRPDDAPRQSGSRQSAR